jgi:tetratricopeptide (TPR) repeat protein
MPEQKLFVLEVLKAEASLKMSLFESADFASTLRHYSQAKVSFDHISQVCGEIVAILNKAGARGPADDGSLKALKKAGGLLWDQLLTKSVKERLKGALALDLVLTIDEELISIPWELLYDGENFLCLKFNIGRLLHTGHMEPQPMYRSARSTLKMLILANPTADLHSAYQEGLAIRNTFDSRRHQLSIDFKSTVIDTLYVKKNLGEYDIVHYAGHCEYDRQDPQNSGWILNDGRLTGRDILTMAESFPMPSLVFSNACQSAKDSDTLVADDYQMKTYGMAAAFLFSGVRHYIGAIQRIQDPVSLTYAREFYQMLRRGRSVGEAVRQSRMRLVRNHGMQSLYWASYLLYGNPGVALFRKPGSTKAAAEKTGVHWYVEYRKALVWAACCCAVWILIAVLYAWLPSINPNAYFLLRSARQELAKGRNEAAIARGERILAKEHRMRQAYLVIAEARTRMGEPDRALQNYFDYALASDRAQDHKGVAYAYSMIGWLYQQQGNYTKAFEFYEKSLAEAGKNRDALNEAIAMRKLAVWYMDKEDNDKALELLTKSSEINRERQSHADHRYNLACDYFDLGLLFVNKDDLATAKGFYLKSLQLFERMKKRSELSDYYFNLGEISLMEKEYVKALDCYNRGLAIDQAQNNKPSIAADYSMIGELYMDMDNLNMAEEYFNKALVLCSTIHAPPELASASYDMGLLCKKRGRRNKAREFFRQAQEIYASADYPGYEELKKELLSLDN